MLTKLLCNSQACSFRDSYEKFKKAGAEVIGISGDDPASHKVIQSSPLEKQIFFCRCTSMQRMASELELIKNYS